MIRSCGWRALVLVTCVALAAPSHGDSTSITVRDDEGRVVELTEPARRIVTLAPFLTELAFAAGAGDLVVGVTAFSDYPEAARSLPQLGDAYGLDLERLLDLQPDLVLAWSSGVLKRSPARFASPAAAWTWAFRTSRWRRLLPAAPAAW